MVVVMMMMMGGGQGGLRVIDTEGWGVWRRVQRGDGEGERLGGVEGGGEGGCMGGGQFSARGCQHCIQ